MKWLVNVADKVDDETQRLCLRLLVVTRLEYVDVVLESFDDIVRFDCRQGRAIR